MSPVVLAEILATSDVPAGVVNLLTGHAAEVLPHLAAHGDVNGLDLTGVDAELRAELGGWRPGRSSGSTCRGGRSTRRRHPGPPGCGRSSRPRPSGTRPARPRSPVGSSY